MKYNQETMKLDMKYLNYVLVLVREDSNQLRTIEEVVNVIQNHGGTIESITAACLITAYFGAPIEQPNSKQVRIDLINELSEKLRTNLAIIHGECECPVGNVGNESYMNYTALFPDFKSKLSILSSLTFGHVEEI